MWRWFTAPFEVLVSEDAVTVISIILFIFNIEVSGRGKAEAQSISYGETVTMGTVIKVDFRVNFSD